jgi:putative endonuclease
MNETREGKTSTVRAGNRAEQAAARYLARLGYEIVELNYRRKHCEIDIVARLDDLIVFVEVKYRETDEWGGGLEYITPKKLAHMRRAAVTWVSDNRWKGPFDLAAIEVGGQDYEVLEFVESII